MGEVAIVEVSELLNTRSKDHCQYISNVRRDMDPLSQSLNAVLPAMYCDQDASRHLVVDAHPRQPVWYETSPVSLVALPRSTAAASVIVSAHARARVKETGSLVVAIHRTTTVHPVQWSRSDQKEGVCSQGLGSLRICRLCCASAQ